MSEKLEDAMKALCGNYKEYWFYLNKPQGWKGCSMPKGHEGNCKDILVNKR